jgi:hypothetical protein
METRLGDHPSDNLPIQSQSNGESERSNRTLMEGVRSSLYDVKNNQTPNTANQSKSCGESSLTFHSLREESSGDNQKQTTPYEKFSGRKPSVGHFRVLGSET